ncbi:hypothetical protein RBSWK_04714 [Rhodopirellula baltica SWK14]|uniref:Uncharacterized protein n=1 Tax=Rhodopirellula baltica SWK14 TaxID=993516 RepID=L7CAL9_RHOBT|nr:hypothetical protein RBSWK_04714 [Rhodopirellula baltica SWK14]
MSPKHNDAIRFSSRTNSATSGYLNVVVENEASNQHNRWAILQDSQQEFIEVV